MTRRLRAALTALAVLLTTVGVAAPASAADFTGTATLTAPAVAHAGDQIEVVLDLSALSPRPTSFSYSFWTRPAGGGEMVRDWSWTFGTQSGRVHRYHVPVVPEMVGRDVVVQMEAEGPDGERYPVESVTRIEIGTFTTAPASGTVAVTGTPRVGSTLTAVAGPGDWAPTPTTVSTVWRDVDGGGVLGTGPTYALGGADLGRVLYAEVTASRPGFTDSVTTSPWVGAVGPAELTLVSAPRIDGGLRFGRPVTVVPPVLSPTPDSISYQWFRADGTPVVGATEQTLTPTSDLIGTVLYVEATARRAFTQDHVVASNVPGAVGLDQLALVSAPGLPSSAVVGTPLTVTAPTFDVAPDSVGYQWFRTPDVAIPGATGPTYTPTTADVGAQLYVLATAERLWTQPHVVQSTMTGAVALRSFDHASVPTVSGSAILGTVLVADAHADAWSPAPERFTYQWFRATDADPAGAPVPGATAGTYTPTAADAGHWFFVEVTAHGDGMSPYVVGSAPSRTVTTPWAVPADGAPRAEVAQGGRLRVTLHGLVPGVPHQLELHSTPVPLGTVVPDAAGTVLVDVTVPASVSAGAHTLVVLRDGMQVLGMPVTVDALVVPGAPASDPVVAAPAVPVAAAAPVASAAPALATTGARVGTLAGAAGGAVVAGAVLLLAARRRTPAAV